MFLSPVTHKDEIIPEEYYVVTILPSEDGEDGPSPITTIERGSKLLEEINKPPEWVQTIAWKNEEFTLITDDLDDGPQYDREAYIEIQLINQYISVNEKD